MLYQTCVLLIFNTFKLTDVDKKSIIAERMGVKLIIRKKENGTTCLVLLWLKVLNS